MFEEVQTLLKENPIIAGGAGMAAMGWLMVQAKSLPMKLWRTVQDQFSTTMTIYSEDSIFRLVDVWLSRHPSAKHSRRFGVAQWHNRKIDDDDYSLTPGAGLHLLRQGWRFYLVHRIVEDNKGADAGDSYSRRRKQTINITTMGRSQAPLNNLLNEIKHVQEDRETVPVYLWTGFDYSLVERRVKRPIDTVYAPKALIDTAISDLQRFFGRRPWYAERGIPWRRGYLLYGPPGTGKTTLIFALASYFEKPIYIINPSAIDNDNTLQKAINAAGAGFVVIEDIDAVKAAEERETKDRSGDIKAGEAAKSGITLSGLLNAIDGIGAREGRLLFITSNHPDVLDAALVRPGRIDLRLHLGLAGEDEARAMFTKFFPDGDVDNFANEISGALPLAPAELQNRLLGLAEAAA